MKNTLSLIPEQPGVYLMFNEDSDIIYIGKAINLRNRIRSYFQTTPKYSNKIEAMIEQIKSFEYIVTDSEVEALILESSLIKKHQPRYNTLLKDDKGFPYIKITWQDKYPKIMFTKTKKKDKAEYYGPYPGSTIVKELIEIIEKIFPIRHCEKPQFKDRPCLYFHIKQCLGPCVNKTDPDEYRKIFEEIRNFLTGKSTEALINKIKEEMMVSAKRLDFERAAVLRDVLRSIDVFLSKQKVVSPSESYLDVIALVRENRNSVIQLFQIREGKLINSLSYGYDISESDMDMELLTSFIQKHYEHITDIPREIVIPYELDDTEILVKWLSTLKKNKVSINVPIRGYKKQLLDMCTNNAKLTLERKINEQKYSISILGLEELRTYLGMNKLPLRIEAFDISNISGEYTVASMIVFVNGKPSKSDYRKYRIKSTIDGVPDDYRSMNEVVFRRYKRVMEEKLVRPDLILIDGGKGQLSTAMNACTNLGYKPDYIIGLAKAREEIFTPDVKEPIILPENSSALKLIQQVRDEAHRFALKFHTQLRGKSIVISKLDKIEGIGPKRKKYLLKVFGSVDKIAEKSVEELIKYGKLPKEVAQKLYNDIRNT